jgi:hypothetical protein
MSEDYLSMVNRLKKPGEEIKLTPNQASLWHMATLLAEESSEVVDAINEGSIDSIMKKFGDMEFAIAGLMLDILPEDINDYVSPMPSTPYAVHGMPSHIPDLAEVMFVSAGRVLSIVKKHAVYGKELEKGRIIEELEVIMGALLGLYIQHKLTQEQIRELNQKKLSIRYPSGYSDEAARNRAEAEK